MATTTTRQRSVPTTPTGTRSTSAPSTGRQTRHGRRVTVSTRHGLPSSATRTSTRSSSSRSASSHQQQQQQHAPSTSDQQRRRRTPVAQCPRCGCAPRQTSSRQLMRCVQCGWSREREQASAPTSTSSTPPGPPPGPVRPVGVRPWQASPDCLTQPAQLDLSGQPIPVASPPPAAAPVARGQQLGLPVTVATSYHSTAWGGRVTQAPLTSEEE